jgi:hypothetical protein
MDEAFLLTIAVAVLATPWVLAIFALVRATRLRGRVETLESRLARTERHLAEAVRAAALATTVATPSPAPTAPASASEPEPEAAGRRRGLGPVSGRDTPPGRPPPLPPIPPPAPDVEPLEHRIVLVWFTRIGALAVLAGVAWFFKYAVDNRWIGPAGRVAIGAFTGAAILGFAEWHRARAKALYVQALQGTGVAILFAAAYASHALYQLVPVGAAFAAVAVIALVAGALAVRGRSELVLALALAGGLLAPVVLSTGDDRPAALFGYLAVLGALVLAASARLEFRIAPFLAMAGTVVLFAGWHDRFFHVHAAFTAPWSSGDAIPAGAYHVLGARLVPLLFVGLFQAEWLGFWERVRRGAPAVWSAAWLAASLALAHVLPWALLHDSAPGGAAIVVAAGLLSAALLDRAGRPILQPASAALAALLVAASAADAGLEDRHAWLAVAGTWAVLHLAVVAHAWRVRREAPSGPRVVTAALAVLGVAGFAIALTRTDESLLRASVVGGAGVAALALGAASMRASRARATVLLGAAIGLFAGAAALLLSGASVTVVWAALGCVAAVLAARGRDRLWLAGAGALFLAALARIVAVDLDAPAAATRQFLDSLGQAGALAPRVLLNARALALAGAAAALLVAAHRCAREAGWFRRAAATFATLGHALLVALAVLEARGAALSLPAPPQAGDAAGFEAYAPELWRAAAAQALWLDTVTTLVLGLAAAVLVAIGFAARQVLQRWLGLALFAITLAKLLLFDVWRLSRLQQIAVFLAIGVLMLAAAFLYARFGNRILRLLSDETDRDTKGPSGAGGPALLALLAAASLAGAGPASALDPAPFRLVRPVEGVNAPGPWAFEVDAALYRQSEGAPGTLADVRLEAPGGAELPWTLRDVAPAEPEVVLEAALVDPAVFPDGKVRAVLDLGREGERHDEVRLTLAGEDFLRPVRVESSDDGRRWGVLADGARVYAVAGLPEAQRTWVRHPASDARFLRVTLLPGAGAPPRILAARVARGAAREPVLRSLAIGAPVRGRSPDGRTTTLDLDLGAAGLPIVALDLEVATPAFERAVRVLASADGAYWVPVGGGVVWRALAGGRTGAREELRVEWPTAAHGRFVRLEVRDGDAAPLDVRGVRAAWRAQQVVFRAEAAGAHRLYVGSAATTAPAYDLGAVLARTPDLPIAAAKLGAASPNQRHALRDEERPFTERHRGALGAGLAALFGALALWAMRMLRAKSEG